MPEASITVTPYDGSLLAAQLLSSSKTLVLSSFGAPETGSLIDNDGALATDDNGVTTFNGQPVSYIGSGSAQPGVNVLGVTVPLGASVPMVAFEAGGQIYFHYPMGPPNVLGAVAVVVTLGTAPYQIFTPVCFRAGTLIATTEGERPIETLKPGDRVLDWEGCPEEILWIGGRRMTLAMGLARSFFRWLPVRVAAGALGNGLPRRDLWISQQHRLMICSPIAELMFGTSEVLASAKSFVGDHVTIEATCREVEYWHLLCPRHTILQAEGAPAESLFLGDIACQSSAHASVQEALDLFPELQGQLHRERTVIPVLRQREAQLVLRGMH